MRAITIAAILVLSSCSRDTAAEDAERRYEIARSSMVGPVELCRLAGEVAGEWLKREDQLKYQSWNVRRELHCRGELAPPMP